MSASPASPTIASQWVDPLIVTVAPNGAYKQPADHSAVPITPATLATTAKACLDAGAAMLHMHIRDATENRQVSKIRLPSEIHLMCRHFLSDPILDVDRYLYRFGPIELGQALFFQHCPCRFHNRPILPLGHAVLLRRVSTTKFTPNSHLL